MWVGATAKLWTLVAVGTLVTGLSARGQQASTSNGGDSAPGNLQIVGLTQIDQNGAAVPDDTLHLRIPLAIQGTCPPVSIAMAGPLTGADAALGTNVQDGAKLAVDVHNAANPGCQVQLKTFDTEGRSPEGNASRPHKLSTTHLWLGWSVQLFRAKQKRPAKSSTRSVSQRPHRRPRTRPFHRTAGRHSSEDWPVTMCRDRRWRII